MSRPMPPPSRPPSPSHTETNRRVKPHYGSWLDWAAAHPIRLTLASWLLTREGYQLLDRAMGERSRTTGRASEVDR